MSMNLKSSVSMLQFVRHQCSFLGNTNISLSRQIGLKEMQRSLPKEVNTFVTIRMEDNLFSFELSSVRRRQSFFEDYSDCRSFPRGLQKYSCLANDFL